MIVDVSPSLVPVSTSLGLRLCLALGGLGGGIFGPYICVCRPKYLSLSVTCLLYGYLSLGVSLQTIIYDNVLY